MDDLLGNYVLSSDEFSRLPDSATLAPLRMVKLISRQGRLGVDVSLLRLAVEAAYLGECDFSMVFVIFSKPESREYGFIHGGQSLWKSKTFNRDCIRHTTLSVVVNDGGLILLF